MAGRERGARLRARVDHPEPGKGKKQKNKTGLSLNSVNKGREKGPQGKELNQKDPREGKMRPGETGGRMKNSSGNQSFVTVSNKGGLELEKGKRVSKSFVDPSKRRIGIVVKPLVASGLLEEIRG